MPTLGLEPFIDPGSTIRDITVGDTTQIDERLAGAAMMAPRRVRYGQIGAVRLPIGGLADLVERSTNPKEPDMTATATPTRTRKTPPLVAG